MATNTFVHLRIPEAARLADLTGIEWDLERAQKYAQQMKTMLEADPPNYSWIEPLSTAALISYCRAFVTGVRAPLRHEVDETFNAEQIGKHELIRALRDKHVAHSVNSFEESLPTARYWIERVEEEGITAISQSHSRVIGLSSFDIETLIDLTEVMLERVRAEMDSEKTRLLEIVRGIPLEQILAMGSEPVLVGSGPVDQRRIR